MFWRLKHYVMFWKKDQFFNSYYFRVELKQLVFNFSLIIKIYTNKVCRTYAIYI